MATEPGVPFQAPGRYEALSPMRIAIDIYHLLQPSAADLTDVETLTFAYANPTLTGSNALTIAHAVNSPHALGEQAFEDALP